MESNSCENFGLSWGWVVNCITGGVQAYEFGGQRASKFGYNGSANVERNDEMETYIRIHFLRDFGVVAILRLVEVSESQLFFSFNGKV
ncbi:hypothetical protein V6N13_108428 [Hibiscus sabdariffa]